MWEECRKWALDRGVKDLGVPQKGFDNRGGPHRLWKKHVEYFNRLTDLSP